MSLCVAHLAIFVLGRFDSFAFRNDGGLRCKSVKQVQMSASSPVRALCSPGRHASARREEKIKGAADVNFL